MNKRRLAIAMVVASIVAAACLAWYLESDAYCQQDRSCWQLYRLAQYVDLYKLETGAIPQELSVLLDEQPGQWKPPASLKVSDLTDQWGHPIVYLRKVSPSSFRLIIQAADAQADRSGPASEIVRESPK